MDTRLPEPAIDHFRALCDAGDLVGAERAGSGLFGGPHGADALTRLGVLRHRHGQTAAAAEAMLRAEALGQPLPPWFHGVLAGLMTELKEWPRALAAAEAGLGAKPFLGLIAATALAHLGRPGPAAVRLVAAGQAVGADPARAGLVASACAALLAADAGPGTREAVRRAAAPYADAPELAAVRAALAGEAELERSVLEAPDSEAAVFRLRDALARTLPPDQVTERLSALQARAEMPLPALMLVLARAMPIDRLRGAFAAQIARWQRSEAVAAVGAYLDALCRLSDPGATVIARMLAVPDQSVRLFFLLREPGARVIRVLDPSPDEAAWLAAQGVDLPATQAFVAGLVGGLEPAWAQALEAADFASAEAARIVRHDERFTAFQDRIVRDRAFPMTDPLGGGPADLFDSVKIFDRQVFAFHGAELLTFHAGGNMNFALFLHLVRLNAVLLVDTRAAPSKLSFYSAGHYLCEVQAVWLRRAARNHAALLASARAARAARGAPRRIVAIHGRAENPAHHIWNYLPAFERLALAGTIGRLDAVVAPPTHYYGALQGLFPELAGAEMRDIPEAAAIDPCPFSPTEIALQLGASFIPAALRRRIHAWAERATPAPRRAEIARAAHGRTVVWLGLRVGDKAWVDQAGKLARVIDLVQPLHPDALFVLDGFSHPDGAPAAPEKWRAAVEALAREADAVQAATAHPEAVLGMVGNTLAESVLWAARADAYLAPLGSSQHKVGWHTSAPGVVYTSPALARQAPEARQGSWEADGARVPDFIIGAVADPGRRRGPHDYRTNLENVDFPAHEAARRLVAALAKPRPIPPAASAPGCR